MSLPDPNPGGYRLRGDLVVVEQVQGGKPYFVVKHPGTGRVYGLSRGSYELMRELGAGTPVDEVTARALARGDHQAREKIAEFVWRMRESGLLEGGARLVEAPAGAPARLLEKLRRFNPLYIKLGRVDPTPLLRRLEGVYYPLFTRPALIAFLVGLAAASSLIALHGARFWHSFLLFRSFHWWAFAYVLLTLAAIVHELGHAMACRKQGGEVPEVGFVIYLLQVGMYTNVTDAWLFPQRRQRIIVSLAGVYVETWLFIAGIVVWSLSRPFSTVNQIAFVVAVVLATRVVLNLFPFLRLDGYFVLTDVLAVRNLRPKSFALLLSYLPRLGRPFRPARAPAPREKIILTLYGSVSLATLALVLPLALRGIHMRLVHHSPRWGTPLFVTLLCILLPMIGLSLKRSLDKLKTAPPRAEVRS